MCDNKNVGKSIKRGDFKAKTLMMILAVTLIICGIVGGTVAWLIDKTAPVVNTFTYGDINITLEETDTGDGDGDLTTNTYTMIPGNTIIKDPEVTVLADSEDSWLFVKLDKSTDPNFDTFMEYEMADGWISLDGVDGVYYREVTKTDSNVEYTVIKNNTVTVKGDVTKEMFNALTTYPTLTVTAYAVQRDSDIDAIDTASEAWALIKN
ncbi:MAG: hypothetical protein UIM53_04445 [Acutalibacteraceae bacterium]|nr:hypothetical protein [Acutalibacteraceae bacterium]